MAKCSGVKFLANNKKRPGAQKSSGLDVLVDEVLEGGLPSLDVFAILAEQTA